MRKKWSRDLALLSVPILVLGAVGFVKARGGSLAAPLRFSNPFDPGPMRLEYADFQPSKLSEMEIKLGYDWAASTPVQQVGRWNEPPGWKQVASMNPGGTRDLRVIYRRGGLWHKAKGAKLIGIALDLSNKGTKFRVNLESLPQDAEEVRLRGYFEEAVVYSGLLPAAWKPPEDLRIAGPNRFLTLRSKPFDVLIKGVGEPMPKSPTLSRVSPIRFVKAYYQKQNITRNNMTNLEGLIYLRFHRDPKYGPPSNDSAPALESFAIRDGNGKQLKMCDSDGSGCGSTPAGFGISTGERVRQDIPATDFLICVLSGSIPVGGWEKHKGPFTLEASFSDAGNFPVKVKVPVRWDMPLEDAYFPNKPF